MNHPSIDPSIIALLLNAKGINVNQNQVPTGENRKNPENHSVNSLFAVCQYGCPSIVKILLNVDGIEVNTQSSTGATPLLQASQNGHVEVVKLLVDHPNIEINLPVHDDCRNGCAGRTPLMMASVAGQVDVVRLLLQIPNIDLNKRGVDGQSALGLAKHFNCMVLQKRLKYLNSEGSNQTKVNHKKVIKLLKLAGAQ